MALACGRAFGSSFCRINLDTCPENKFNEGRPERAGVCGRRVLATDRLTPSRAAGAEAAAGSPGQRRAGGRGWRQAEVGWELAVAGWHLIRRLGNGLQMPPSAQWFYICRKCVLEIFEVAFVNLRIIFWRMHGICASACEKAPLSGAFCCVRRGFRRTHARQGRFPSRAGQQNDARSAKFAVDCIRHTISSHSRMHKTTLKLHTAAQADDRPRFSRSDRPPTGECRQAAAPSPAARPPLQVRPPEVFSGMKSRGI